ncbi:MAG: hypothetical protein WBB98_13365 [Xanthobacteraceae bacterium]
MIRPADLAQNLYRDPVRAAEAERLYRALHGALSAVHTEGEQDALAIWEALSLMIAQLTAGLPDNVTDGVLAYIEQRVRHHRPEFASVGCAARHRVEGLQ